MYSVIASYGIYKLTEHTVGVRVTAEEETKGLDEASLGERAYRNLEKEW